MPSFLVIHIIIIIIYYTIILLIDYMGVDQNKGIWGSYNRRSTTNQPRSQRCQSREGSVVCNIILRRESSKHCYISQIITVSKDMAWARAYPGRFSNRGAIADQPRTNRGFHRHVLKIDLIWVVRLWTCCSMLFWFFFAISYHIYHYWTQCQGRPKYPKYSIRLKCHIIIMPWKYNCWFLLLQ